MLRMPMLYKNEHREQEQTHHTLKRENRFSKTRDKQTFEPIIMT